MFRSGRDFSAWIGLVPKQNSSGGKDRLGNISKRGDRYLRSLFTTGALAVGREVLRRLRRAIERCRRTYRRQPLLPGRERPHFDRERRAGRPARQLSLGGTDYHHCIAGNRAIGTCGAHRPARPEDKRLLQSASVIGKDFALGLLGEIADADADTVQRGLANLQAAEFIYETRLFPDREYTLAHTFGLQAGRRAAAQSANRAALEAFQDALAALEYLPETPQTIAENIDLRFELRDAHLVLSEMASILLHLKQARALAERIGDRQRMALAALYESGFHWIQGEHHLAVELGLRGLAAAEELDRWELRGLAHYRVGTALLFLGEHITAANHLRKSVAALDHEEGRTLLRFGGLVFAFIASFGHLRNSANLPKPRPSVRWDLI